MITVGGRGGWCRCFTLILFPMTEPGYNPGEESVWTEPSGSIRFAAKTYRVASKYRKHDSTVAMTRFMLSRWHFSFVSRVSSLCFRRGAGSRLTGTQQQRSLVSAVFRSVWGNEGEPGRDGSLFISRAAAIRRFCASAADRFRTRLPIGLHVPCASRGRRIGRPASQD